VVYKVEYTAINFLKMLMLIHIGCRIKTVCDSMDIWLWITNCKNKICNKIANREFPSMIRLQSFIIQKCKNAMPNLSQFIGLVYCTRAFWYTGRPTATNLFSFCNNLLHLAFYILLASISWHYVCYLAFLS